MEVNTETGEEVKVLKMTTAVDPGPVIHPQNLEGQLEGGMDQVCRVCAEGGICQRKNQRLGYL